MEKFCIGIEKISDITYGSELILYNFSEIVKDLIRPDNLRFVKYGLIKGEY